MSRKVHSDIDLRARLLLAGSAGTAGHVMTSNGASNPPTYQAVSASVSDGDKGDITVSGGTWTIDNQAVTYAKLQNVSETDRLLGRSSSGAGVVEEITCTAAGRALIDDADAAAQRATLGVAADHTISVTAVDKTLVNRERCTVTASGKTITLPASPSAGWEVSISIAGTFTDTVIARNGANIMSLAENMTVDVGNTSVTLYYVDATRGWRLL